LRGVAENPTTHRRGESRLPWLWSPSHTPGDGALPHAQAARDRNRRFTGSDKPPGWKRWSPAEKAEHLFDLSLDRMHDYLSRPGDGLLLQRRRKSSVWW